MCDDLSCTKDCPSGALQPVSAENVDMGIAEVDPELCVRRQGEDCQICVDKCPVGPLAIDIPDLGGEVEVKVDGCTGCGVCQMYCPTDPRAIVVRPRED
jgi:ferredoxin-type protein NapG